MRSAAVHLLLALGSALFTLGCGEGDESGGPSYADSMSTADAVAFSAEAVALTGQAVRQLNFGTGSDSYFDPILLTRFALAGRPTRSSPLYFSDADCSEVLRGYVTENVWVDVDENGIPDDLYFKMDCTVVDDTSDPDTVVTVIQTQEVTVRQDLASLHGYLASGTLRTKVSDQFGNSTSSEYIMHEALDIRSGSASHRSDYIERGSVKAGGTTTWYESGRADTTTFTPSGTIVLGDPLPSGALVLHGRAYGSNSAGENLFFALMTETPLAYDAACHAADDDPPFSAGVLKGRLNNNATQGSFTTTFTGCGVAPTVGVEGAYDLLAESPRPRG